MDAPRDAGAGAAGAAPAQRGAGAGVRARIAAPAQIVSADPGSVGLQTGLGGCGLASPRTQQWAPRRAAAVLESAAESDAWQCPDSRWRCRPAPMTTLLRWQSSTDTRWACVDKVISMVSLLVNPYGADFREFLPGHMGGGAAVDTEALAEITRTVQVEMAQQVRAPEKKKYGPPTRRRLRLAGTLPRGHGHKPGHGHGHVTHR